MYKLYCAMRDRIKMETTPTRILLCGISVAYILTIIFTGLAL